MRHNENFQEQLIGSDEKGRQQLLDEIEIMKVP